MLLSLSFHSFAVLVRNNERSTIVKELSCKVSDVRTKLKHHKNFRG
jgi:hypothetical protein